MEQTKAEVRGQAEVSAGRVQRVVRGQAEVSAGGVQRVVRGRAEVSVGGVQRVVREQAKVSAGGVQRVVKTSRVSNWDQDTESQNTQEAEDKAVLILSTGPV